MENQAGKITSPHQGQPVRMTGEPLETARAAMVLLHGRGAMAEDILTLTDPLDQPGFAYLAPQAQGNTWYPNRFMAPLESNEPWLSSALMTIDDLLGQIAGAGIPVERTLLLGFSQGGCLALEYAARNPRRFGGLVGLSAALIGPLGIARDRSGTLAGTPVFLGCSDVDYHIPQEYVQNSTAVLRQMGGQVTERFYTGMDHVVNQDEIDFVRAMMVAILKRKENED